MVDRLTPALTLADIRVDRGGRAVVRDISVTVASASWFGVIGANGSGKTTLLRGVAGRLPIAAGRCEIFGEESASDRSARAKAIGFAPPIERLPAALTIGTLLTLAGDPRPIQAHRNQRLWNALGIADLTDRRVGECSSGMRQRAALALAFARPVAIVILDEPFNWLDPVAAFDTRAALAAQVRAGVTLVTALHDLTTLCGYCDAGIVMANGRLSLDLSQSDLRAGKADAERFERELVAALR